MNGLAERIREAGGGLRGQTPANHLGLSLVQVMARRQACHLECRLCELNWAVGRNAPVGCGEFTRVEYLTPCICLLRAEAAEGQEAVELYALAEYLGRRLPVFSTR